MVPVIDVVEVGAGGGSIAWIDEIGALKVGPQSAGADPGPICYRGGGTEPTITDANLVLGRLDPEDFLGGQMALAAVAAAQGIVDKIAGPLKMSPTAAAQAIVDIAVSKMSLAVREVSVAKGYDPRDFALVASGGAGPLHATAVARELHIPKVIVPLYPAHFSALGMLAADERHDFIRTFYADLAAVDFRQLERTVEEMAAESTLALGQKKGAEHRIHLDLRYVGQEFTLSVRVAEREIKSQNRRAIRAAFDRLYDQRYAHHSPEEPVEIVNIRLAVIGKRATLKFARLAARSRVKPFRKMQVHLGDPARPVSCPVYRREELGAGARIAGPALVREHGTTTVLFKGDVCTVARTGELLISVRGAA
jgi:N-methylhydantoinase A